MKKTMPKRICRPSISSADMERVLKTATSAWQGAMKKKGPGIFASCHEISGVLDEEVDEAKREVKRNSPWALRNELLDVIVVALHGIASIESEQMSW